MSIPSFQNIYTLYQECFGEFPECCVDYEFFCQQLDPVHCKVLEREGGVALLSETSVLLLMVPEHKRGRGIGSQLLEEGERILFADQEKIQLGASTQCLFPGVPLLTPSSADFFKHRGYTAPRDYVNMLLPLEDFNLLECPAWLPEGLTFGLIPKEQEAQLIQAVASVDENWCVYFHPEDNHVYGLHQGEEIVGFVILDFDGLPYRRSPGEKVGSIGCVGVVPQKRSSGAGLAMVAHAAQLLKNSGSGSAFIGFTHLEHWYAKLGAKVIRRFWTGEKSAPLK
jgi:ribosomal protein S18 acetylase RimI-like enzyme